MLTEPQIVELHALYERLTGYVLPLTLHRQDAWQAWARQIGLLVKRAELPGLTLRLALEAIVKHRRTMYRDKPHTLAATLKFGHLVERVSLAEEDLSAALADRRARAAAVDPARAAVLQATGRAQPETPAQPAGEIFDRTKFAQTIQQMKQAVEAAHRCPKCGQPVNFANCYCEACSVEATGGTQGT